MGARAAVPFARTISSTIRRSFHRTFEGKAYSASLPAQKLPKGRKNVTKEQRRVLTEEFVEKYRALNDGKFPSIKTVRQHVGGGHYTVRGVLQELKYNQTRLPLDKSKAAQLKGEAEFSEHLRPEDGNANNLFSSPILETKQDVDDMIVSQKIAVTSTEIIEKTETVGSLELEMSHDSSHCNGEAEASKQDFHSADMIEITNDSNLSSQAESDTMKIESSISLGLETTSDSGKHHVESDVNKLDLNPTKNLLDASEPPVSDHPEVVNNDKVFKTNVLGREESPKVEHEEPANAGLFGSLRSLAYGLKNFWKNL